MEAPAVVRIKIGAAGKPKRAVVESVVSPPVDPTSFAPGTYAGGGVTCTLVLTQPSDQRYDLLCTDDDEPGVEPKLAWFAGDFLENDFLPTLQQRRIDELPGHEDIAWGLALDVGGDSAFTDCIDDTASNGVLSSAQSGANLIITFYGGSKTANCSVALLLVEP